MPLGEFGRVAVIVVLEVNEIRGNTRLGEGSEVPALKPNIRSSVLVVSTLAIVAVAELLPPGIVIVPRWIDLILFPPVN